MRLIILGAPGAGKGTQAAMLSLKLKVPHISTGDIFRNNIKGGTELGKKAKEYIDKGQLVPDAVTIDIVKDRLEQQDCTNGFILDGFPRTIPQAEYLDEVLKDHLKLELDFALNILVLDSEIIKRMSGRRVCPNCGASYHLVYKPTKEKGSCDLCKTPVVQRDDDKEETVLQRLQIYHKQTEPLISYYKNKGKLKTVEGREDVNHTSSDVVKALGI
jgi:adenylate kinase